MPNALFSALDTVLTDDELNSMTIEVDAGFWPNLTLESIIGSRDVDPGTVSIIKNKYDGVATPERIAESGFFPKDRIKRYSETLYVEERGISFDIPKKTIDIFKNTGELINRKYLQRTGRALATSVEDVSLARMQVLGTAAGMTFDVSTDGDNGKLWDTVGADPYGDVLDMLSELDDVGFVGDTLWIDNKLMRKIQKKDSHGDRIIDDIYTVVDNIQGSSRLSKGTGLLFDSTQSEFIYSQKPNILSDFRSGNRVYETSVAYEGVVDVEDPDSILVLTLGATS